MPKRTGFPISAVTSATAAPNEHAGDQDEAAAAEIAHEVRQRRLHRALRDHAELLQIPKRVENQHRQDAKRAPQIQPVISLFHRDALRFGFIR